MLLFIAKVYMSNSKENQKSIDPYTDALHFLGVTTSAGIDELRSRYRKLALNYHPDKGGTVELMQKLNKSYELAVTYSKINNPVGKEGEIPFDTHGEDGEDSFADLFARFANDTTYKPPEKEESRPKRNHTVWYEKPTVEVVDEKSVFEYQLGLSQKRLASQYDRIAHASSLSDILSGVFSPTRVSNPSTIQEAQTILGGKNRDEAKHILLLAAHIAEPSMQMPVSYSFALAEAIGYAPYHDGMLKISKQCDTFLFDAFRLFITPTDNKKINRERNTLFISLFKHLFRTLNDASSDEKINEHLAFFEKVSAKVSDFIPHSSKDKEDEAHLERGKIFGLIFHDGVSMEDRFGMVEACSSLLNSTYYNSRTDLNEKIRSILTYLEDSGWSSKKILCMLQGVAYIQSQNTRIYTLGQKEKIFSFGERLEQTIGRKHDTNDNDLLSSQMSQFISSVKQGSRGYRDCRDVPATNEWITAFENGFEIFRNEPILFNTIMNIFHEFSISPQNKLVLASYESIRIPIESAVHSAIKLIVFFNTKYGNEFFEKEEDLKQFKKVIHMFQQKRYYEIHKRQNYSSFPENQQKLYQFFNSIQRRRSKKGMFLPEDIDIVIDLYFQAEES